MTAVVIPFLSRRLASSDWTQAELAEFYRVEAALLGAGMAVETDRGRTDEGEPWFVFCHAEGDQDVIIHFARLDGGYLVSAPGLGGAAIGSDFRSLVRRLLSDYETIAARRQQAAAKNDGKVVLHPAAMLWVLVAVAFLKSAEARAFETGAAPAPDHPAPRDGAAPAPLADMITFAMQAVMVALVAAEDLLGGAPQSGQGHSLLAWLAVQTGGAAGIGDASVPPPHAPGAPRAEQIAIASEWAGHHGSGWAPAVPPVSTFSAAPVAPAHPEIQAGFALALESLGGGHSAPPPQAAQDPAAASAPSVPQSDALTVIDAAEHGAPVLLLPAPPAPLAAMLGHAWHLTDGNGDLAGALTQTEQMLRGAETQASAAPYASPAPASASATSSVAANPAAAPASHDAGIHDAGSGASSAAGVAASDPSAGLAQAPTPQATEDAAPSAHAASPVPPVTEAPTVAAPVPAAAVATQVAPTTDAGSGMGSGAGGATFATPPLDSVKLAAAAVQDFLFEVPQAKTIATPNGIIVYDPLPVDIDAAHVQAVTFDFSDGSHISLVGLPGELTYALTGHH